ncbi:MAG TPA: SusC/RagA family TonB-linked outer membrane protein [Flavitalea sp.]|nr:SusC/RagA family TonB-linked outer membrane protein [Flavitalea sp.]
MKKLNVVLVLVLLLVAGIPAAFAQSRTVTGKISDASGAPIQGANVLVKGTNIGATTNAEGVYTISVPSGSNTLIVSYVGHASQELNLGGRTNVNVSLTEDSGELERVVVTALGIEKSQKALGFSQTTVNGENFTQAREISTANALAGRVAGVNVSKIASGPGGSSRVVIRGAKTLGSTLNQPLYVVDGVPIDNSNFGQAGIWGGADQGDGMNSINPDDIASMTVLKGASAAALYGSRAANGVILITTKKGTNRKGVGIEVNSNYVFEKVQNLTDFQHSYGNGGYSGADLETSVAKTPGSIEEHWNNWWGLQAWGPKFDGSPTVQWDGITRPYSYAGDNWDRFYKTGSTFTNSVALTGGSETQSFRFSASNLKNIGVIPNSGFDRVNLSLSANAKFAKKLTFSSKVMYSNEKVKNRPNISDSPGNGILSIYYIPGDVNVLDMIGDPNKPGAVPSIEDQQKKGIRIFDNKPPGEEFQVSNNLWTQNPYWAAYQQINSDQRDRVIATSELRYDITDFLYLSGQAGMDWFTKRGTQLTPQGTGHNRGGSMSENEVRTREINYQYMLGFNKTFSAFGVNAFVGGNRMRRLSESIAANGSGFNTPLFPAINNANQRNFDYGYGKSGINSLFGSVELSYNNYLFITGTARQDWFSVLNPKDNSILYPSIGASFVFTDAIQTLPSFISYGKVRASWAQVGNVSSVNPYQTTLLYGAGNTHVGRPLGGFTSGENFPNPDLKPFTSTESEFGLDVRFFNNRLGVDLTYYSQKTTDDILDANISQTSGFRTTTVNLGQITNKGVELLLTGTPIKSEIQWDISLNFAKNKSNVVSLIEGQTEVIGEEPRTRTVFIKHIIGHPYGMITGQTQLRDPATGLLVYDASGTPLTDGSYQILGNGVPDFTGGLNNSFTFKNINLSFLIDFKSGGDIYSGTNVRMTQSGFTKQTLLGRAGEAPLVVTGVTDDGAGGYKPFSKTLTPGEAQNYWSNLGDRAAEKFVYDASFIKLRQITLGYNLSKKILSRTPIQNLMVSFVARNLAILKKNTPNIDPESSYTSSNSQGLDYFGFPATRTFGFNVRATF